VESGEGGISRQKATRFAAVEGIPVCGKAVTFAGRRQNAGLGSVRFKSGMGLLPSRRRTGDSGCPEVAEEGNVRPHVLFEVHAPFVRKS
jgi:hypothetical protein